MYINYKRIFEGNSARQITPKLVLVDNIEMFVQYNFLWVFL